jgi:hypothetical protein
MISPFQRAFQFRLKPNRKDGVKNGTVSLGFTAAFNLVKEFIWKK